MSRELWFALVVLLLFAGLFVLFFVVDLIFPTPEPLAYVGGRVPSQTGVPKPVQEVPAGGG